MPLQVSQLTGFNKNVGGGTGAATLSYIGAQTNTGATNSTSLTCAFPTAAATDDICVFTEASRNAANFTCTPPSGWTCPQSGTKPMKCTTAGLVNYGVFYKKLTASDITAGKVTTASPASLWKSVALHVFRYSGTISTITAKDTDNSGLIVANPVAQTITSSGGTAPLIVIGVGFNNGTGWDNTPGFDTTTISAGTNEIMIGSKIYNASPANITADVGAPASTQALTTGYLEIA